MFVFLPIFIRPVAVKVSNRIPPLDYEFHPRFVDGPDVAAVLTGCSEDPPLSEDVLEQTVRLGCTHPDCDGVVETTYNDQLARGCIGIDLEAVGRPPEKCAKCPRCQRISLVYDNPRPTGRDVGVLSFCDQRMVIAFARS